MWPIRGHQQENLSFFSPLKSHSAGETLAFHWGEIGGKLKERGEKEGLVGEKWGERRGKGRKLRGKSVEMMMGNRGNLGDKRVEPGGREGGPRE